MDQQRTPGEDDFIEIDETSHKPIPTAGERAVHSLQAILIGFVLVQIIGFWMFPGIGVGGLYIFSYSHSITSFVGDLTNILILTFLAIFGLLGWFHGRYFIDRLKGYITWWKFW
ncbi:hypothetical protein ACG2F4_04255 [Halalkalibaculum sp. DA3122]|uniref:hypothetical protein n=1 Tax=Halalkalibaculum sp. DA3122 TaxID=3373607 RepID=UPI0037553DFD